MGDWQVDDHGGTYTLGPIWEIWMNLGWYRSVSYHGAPLERAALQAARCWCAAATSLCSALFSAGGGVCVAH